MTVKTDVRYVANKKSKGQKTKKTSYKCEGSYIDIDGNPHRYHKRGFPTREEAKEWERNFLIEAQNNISSRITFKKLCEIYLETKRGKVKDRSFASIISTVNNHIIPFWGDIPLSKITLNKIEEWQNELLLKTYVLKRKNVEKNYSNSRLEYIQTRFRAILTYGIKMGYITDNRVSAFITVKKPAEIKTEMLYWRPEEYAKFIVCVDSLPYYTLFNLLYWCGLRLGEALALSWRDIDFDKKTVYIRKTYTKAKHQITSPKSEKSNRDILIPSICMQALISLHEVHKKYIGYTDEKWVFNFDKHMDPNTITRHKDAWVKQAGIKRIRIHDFRHSHVSLLIYLKYSAFDIANRLGHTVDMVNNVYGHWFTDVQLDMVNSLNEISKTWCKFGVNYDISHLKID